MNRIAQTAFRSTVEFLRSEVELMPLDRWNESVFRYQFCRFIAAAHPQVEQFVECDRIDLVLRRPPLVAFIEFKLVYADPVEDSHRKCGFSEYYDDYRHPRDSVSLCRIEYSGPIKTSEAIVRAQLYEIT